VSTAVQDHRSPVRTRWGRTPEHLTRTDVLVTMVATLVVAAPMLFTDSGFAPDFTNHLWLSWAAGKELVRSGFPSYFVNTSNLGAFYPLFAFYGGTLYTITGGLGELLGGHPVLAYVGVTTIAIAGVYGGMLWLSRQLGVRGWVAHAPALAAVTSAYYITDLYGRGAWPEFMATSAMAPLLASCVYLGRGRPWRPIPILIFVLSAVVFSGSHNITLLWATTVAAVALVVIWLALGAPRTLPYRRLAAIAGLGVSSVLVNAWFLFPDLAYSGKVEVSENPVINWAYTSYLNTPATLLDPLRHVPAQSSTPAIFVQIPDWFLAWALAAGALLLWRRRADARLRRAWTAVVMLIGALLAMIMLAQFWSIVPFPFDEIQFPYRLGAYVYYAVAGLVLIGVLALQSESAVDARSRWAGRLGATLVAVAAISVGLCVWQEWVPNALFRVSYRNRNEALVSVNRFPNSWYDDGSFEDISAPYATIISTRTLEIKPALVHGGHFAEWMNVPSGTGPIWTNIDGGAYLVHISGLERVGRSLYGGVVVKRPHGGSKPVHVVIETAHSAPIELGRLMTLLAILLIVGVLARAGVHSRRARKIEREQHDRTRASPQVPTPVS
jgi:hypothetical protein